MSVEKMILIAVLIVCSVISDTEQKEDYRVQHGHSSSGPSGGDGSRGPSGDDGSSGPSGGDGSSGRPSGGDGSSRPLGGDGNIVVEEGVAGNLRVVVEVEAEAAPAAQLPATLSQASLGGARQASLGGARQASLGGARQASLGGARQASLGGARQASLRGARQARSSPSHGGGGGSDTQGNERVQRDTSQTQENQAEQGHFIEVCLTEKIVSIVLGLSLLLSLIIHFVCWFKNRKTGQRERKTRESLVKEIKELKQERDELEKKNESLVKENEELKQECDELEKKNESLVKEIKELKQERDELEKKNESLVKENEELKQDCDAIREEFNAVGYVVERKWSSIVKAQAEVTLNPDTASPSLTVSEDGSQVRFKGEGSAEWPSVLGRVGFTSRRHYWEVEVGEKGYWTLGVSTHTDEKIIPEKPEEGYWLLRRWKGNTYEAVSQPPVLLTLQHKLYKVGMILDYEKGELSFYNVYDGSTRYEIHTFNYKFTEVYPIFSPGSHDRGPLKITRFKSGDGNPNSKDNFTEVNPIFIPVSQ